MTWPNSFQLAKEMKPQTISLERLFFGCGLLKFDNTNLFFSFLLVDTDAPGRAEAGDPVEYMALW